jgi:hypothetical protein
MLHRTTPSRGFSALGVVLAPIVAGGGCTTDIDGSTGEGAVIGGAQEADTSPSPVPLSTGSSGADPTCNNAGDQVVHNDGFPEHEDGPCPSPDAFTQADAIASCGGSVKYFSYSCADFEEGTHAWTAQFACCSGLGASQGPFGLCPGRFLKALTSAPGVQYSPAAACRDAGFSGGVDLVGGSPDPRCVTFFPAGLVDVNNPPTIQNPGNGVFVEWRCLP